MSTSPAPGKPKVLLMHHFLDPGPALLAEVAEVITYPSNRPLDEQNIRGAAEGCIGIVSQLKDPIGPIVLSTPGLRCVSNVAVGYDNIDVAAATANHVWVTNTPGVLDEATADFAFALMMATARRVVQGDTFVRQGNFKGWEIDMMLGHDVHDATLGIIGIGRIGRGVARRASGFNMRVLYSDQQPLQPEVEKQLGATRVDLPRLLAESDFISIHVPLTALKTHRIAGAGLDVFEREPAVHPSLIAQHNVVLAPHIASATTRTRSEMSAVAARNMATAVRGGRPPNVLNPEARQ